MALRIATALVGLPLLLAVTWAGAPYLTMAVALGASLAWTEYHRMFAPEEDRLALAYGAIWIVALAVGGHFGAEWQAAGLPLPLYLALGAGALPAMAWTLWRPSPSRVRARGRLALGPVYAGFLVAHAVTLRESLAIPGLEWLLFALLTTFATDTAAFFVGRSIGRHPMAPSISPAKTWEGAAGGFLGAVGAGAALAALTELPFWPSLAVAGAVGVTAQLGDLLESRLKRAAGAKDAGGMLPGHGGILDRLDSLVLTIPLVYYQATLGGGT